MKKSSLFAWCLVALVAGVMYESLKHPTIGGVLLFIGLPLALSGCVWRFGDR